MDVQNVGDKDLALQWVQDGMVKKLNVPKSTVLSQTIIIQSVDQPPAMSFSVYDLMTSNLVQVKGKDSFEVTPTLQGDKVIVEIGTKGKDKNFYHTFWVFNHEKKTMILKSVSKIFMYASNYL